MDTQTDERAIVEKYRSELANIQSILIQLSCNEEILRKNIANTTNELKHIEEDYCAMAGMYRQIIANLY